MDFVRWNLHPATPAGYLRGTMAAWPKWFSRRPGRPIVRPWALAGPVIILLICTPLLRPLRAPGLMSAREAVALESARNLLEHHRFALDITKAFPAEAVVGIDGNLISRDPPMFTVVLAATSWLIKQTGVTFEYNLHLLDYLLTLLVSTLPTALACGLVYRIGRVFELNRGWRVALALATVLATGWVSFAVVLLPHALAISLVIAAITAYVQAVRAERGWHVAGWLVSAGFCAAMAATLEPLAIWTLPAVVLGAPFVTRRWPLAIGAMVLVLLGIAIPVAGYLLVNRAATGDLLPPRWHTVAYAGPTPTVVPAIGDDIDPLDVSVWVIIGRAINRLLIYTVGSHGVFSHFPILVIALAGAASVLRRHWAGALKWLAGVTLAALLLLLAYKMSVRVDDVDLDFAAPRLMVVIPAVMIWAGGWIRRRHAPVAWAAAGVALAVSITISLLGATAPAPPGGYTRYTAAEAATRLITKPAAIAREH